MSSKRYTKPSEEFCPPLHGVVHPLGQVGRGEMTQPQVPAQLHMSHYQPPGEHSSVLLYLKQEDLGLVN